MSNSVKTFHLLFRPLLLKFYRRGHRTLYIQSSCSGCNVKWWTQQFIFKTDSCCAKLALVIKEILSSFIKLINNNRQISWGQRDMKFIWNTYFISIHPLAHLAKALSMNYWVDTNLEFNPHFMVISKKSTNRARMCYSAWFQRVLLKSNCHYYLTFFY